MYREVKMVHSCAWDASDPFLPTWQWVRTRTRAFTCLHWQIQIDWMLCVVSFRAHLRIRVFVQLLILLGHVLFCSHSFYYYCYFCSCFCCCWAHCLFNFSGDMRNSIAILTRHTSHDAQNIHMTNKLPMDNTIIFWINIAMDLRLLHKSILRCTQKFSIGLYSNCFTYNMDLESIKESIVQEWKRAHESKIAVQKWATILAVFYRTIPYLWHFLCGISIRFFPPRFFLSMPLFACLHSFFSVRFREPMHTHIHPFSHFDFDHVFQYVAKWPFRLFPSDSFDGVCDHTDCFCCVIVVVRLLFTCTSETQTKQLIFEESVAIWPYILYAYMYIVWCTVCLKQAKQHTRTHRQQENKYTKRTLIYLTWRCERQLVHWIFTWERILKHNKTELNK